ncbi:sigma-70 family RNA polymerase sigma factor [Nocardioides sp. CER19]|uniref:sigma-70 family RNA polymerase sigma factor n=1 Tax=Nocardioides sp. CER19 TaxID=3038538 RepID=UPI00244D6158|nr:sigma-70 family RNA polymerase sigma factor [Nocardioides sp. CER19]MDH2416251.1 sigma-70 family RNA polymerase sigma factor [Nocardioides sp. CER19]
MDDWTRLAVAARDGRDEPAVEAFVRATQADVWRLCAHLGDREHADDLAQEVYARVLRSLRSFRGESPVRPWLFSIVRRVVADDIADRQRRRKEPRPGVRAIPDHQGEVVLTSLLAGLDEERRQAFVLTQVLGYSYADAAELVGCPIGTIRSRVARAREDLVGMVDPAALRRTRLA